MCAAIRQPAPLHNSAGDILALRDLRALIASDAYAATFTSLASYRRQLVDVIASCRGPAALDVGALLVSDAYAITFQMIDHYRAALLDAVDSYVTPIAQLHMTNLVAQLREAQALPLAQQAADHIESLQQRIASQQELMDKAASILAEAINTDGAVKEQQAKACIDAIQGGLLKVGKTTAEGMVDHLVGRIASAAGLRHDAQIDPIHILEQMRTCIAIQGKNAAYLEALIPAVYWKTDEGSMRLRLGPPGDTRACYLTFPPGTPWPQAFDAGLKRLAALKVPEAA